VKIENVNAMKSPLFSSMINQNRELNNQVTIKDYENIHNSSQFFPPIFERSAKSIVTSQTPYGD
jgi:hypothetical protein